VTALDRERPGEREPAGPNDAPGGLGAEPDGAVDLRSGLGLRRGAAELGVRNYSECQRWAGRNGVRP
jgi:hypothetical protein